MKKIGTWKVIFLGFSFVFWGSVPEVFSQVVFQNSNTACEEELVLCDSASSATFCSSDAQSLACKNFSQIADFNGDGFPDCVAAVAADFISVGLGLDVTVLVNNTGASCGNQFAPAIDYDFNGLNTGATLGTVVSGTLDGGALSDIAIPEAFSSRYISTAFNIPATPASDETTLTTTNSNWLPTGSTQSGMPSSSVDRNAALLDCDGDGDLDGALAVRDTGTDFVMLNILRNNGTGLQDINVVPGGSFNTNIIFSESAFASVAVADFDGVNGLDVALAIDSDTSAVGSPDNSIVVCLNNGSCDFSNCLTPLNLDAAHVGQLTEPFSIAAGDFDDNGNADVVVSEPGLATGTRGVHYYLGNGDGTLAATGQHITYNTPADASPGTLTTGFFNNDPIPDVAVNLNAPGTLGSGNVGVFVFNTGTTTFDTTTLSYGANLVVAQGGIDSADFDQQGCDDIMAIATDFTDSSNRKAYVFMNGPQSLVANAGADQTVDANTALTLSGTSCTPTPADPTTVTTANWTVAPSAGVTLTNTTTLTPTFTATQAGTYTLTLTCDTQCTDPVTDTMQVVVPGVPPVAACFLEGSGCNAEGPNICSLVDPSTLQMVKTIYAGQWLAIFILPAGIFAMMRSRRRRGLSSTKHGDL